MKVHTRGENETEVGTPPVASIATQIAMLIRTGAEHNSDQETVRQAIQAFARTAESCRTSAIPNGGVQNF